MPSESKGRGVARATADVASDEPSGSLAKLIADSGRTWINDLVAVLHLQPYRLSVGIIGALDVPS